MSSPIVDALCRMPLVFSERRDISMLALFRETGYDATRSGISESDIEAHLMRHPDLVRTWIMYSYDQRCLPAWYLVEPRAGLEGEEGWRVGYYTTSGQRPPARLFPDEFAACAFFIMRKVEELSELASDPPLQPPSHTRATN